MLLVSCLAISTVSAADIDANDTIASDVSNIELESVNDADLLSNNINQNELSTITNSTIEENLAKNDAAGNEGIYTTNENTVSNNGKVTPIVSIENVTINPGESIIIPFNVTDNEGKLISGGAIVTIAFNNFTLIKYVDVENGKGTVNLTDGKYFGILGDKYLLDISPIINKTYSLFEDFLKNNSAPSSEIPTDSENPIIDIPGWFNITIPDFSGLFNITTPDISKLNITIPEITIQDISKLLNITIPEITIPNFSELFNITIPEITIADIAKLINITMPDFTKLLNTTLPEITLSNITDLVNITLPDFKKIPELSDLLNITLPELSVSDLSKILNVTVPKITVSTLSKLIKIMIPQLGLSNITDLVNISMPDFTKLLNTTLPEITLSNITDLVNITLPEITLSEMIDKIPELSISDISKLLNMTIPEITVFDLSNLINLPIESILKIANLIIPEITIQNITEMFNTTISNIAKLLDIPIQEIIISNITEVFNSTISDIAKLINTTLSNITMPDFAKLLNITIPEITIPNITEMFNITIPEIIIPDFSNVLNNTIAYITNITNGIKEYLSNINLTEINNIIANKSIPIGTIAPGIYNITILYLCNENYTHAINDTSKLIIGSKIIIEADDLVMYYKNGSRYVVKLNDSKGNPLTNKTISITLNGQTYNRTTDSNGSASIAINLNAGNYTASASYTDEDQSIYTVENNINVLSTIKGDNLVKVFRNESQYYATFLDNQGKGLANGTTVTFNINGVMYERKTNEKGVARLNINLNPGEYILTAIHPNNGEMSSNNITVLATIQSRDLVKYYKNDSQYIVTLIGNDGKVVGAGENVTFNINGVFYTRQTNASGQAVLNINLNPGKYIITGSYHDCQVSNNIEVKPVLTAIDFVKSFNEPKAFEATLVDGQGNALPNAVVNFNINGMLYNRTTDSYGIARLNINLQKGEYIITSSYNGQSISNTVTVTD